MDFTFEEQELMSIYNPGTRLGLIQTLNEMRTYLDEDEQELRTLTDSAVYKLSRITDDAFEKLDLLWEVESRFDNRMLASFGIGVSKQ